MADRSSASVTIGGTLSHALLPALLNAIACDHLGVDYGDRVIAEADIVSGVPLYGAAVGVSGGVFEETEAFCREQGLRYVRRSDACPGAWEPSIEIFPGSGDVRNFDATSDRGVVITLADFHRLGNLAAIEAHFAAADFETGPLIIAPNGELSAGG